MDMLPVTISALTEKGNHPLIFPKIMEKASRSGGKQLCIIYIIHGRKKPWDICGGMI